MAYVVSISVFTVFIVKIIDVRSKCTKEKAVISRLISEIKGFKDENNRLLVKFYKDVRPKLVDKKTKDLKILHENEVKYLK